MTGITDQYYSEKQGICFSRIQHTKIERKTSDNKPEDFSAALGPIVYFGSWQKTGKIPTVGIPRGIQESASVPSNTTLS